eukprot:4958116-Prorocentrum_lima.AAC.1
MAPSTFEGKEGEHNYTWIGPTGARHRLDYVALPHAWANSVTRSTVLFETDGLDKNYDHFP